MRNQINSHVNQNGVNKSKEFLKTFFQSIKKGYQVFSSNFLKFSNVSKLGLYNMLLFSCMRCFSAATSGY